LKGEGKECTGGEMITFQAIGDNGMKNEKLVKESKG
jgi:hypothetical protein